MTKNEFKIQHVVTRKCFYNTCPWRSAHLHCSLGCELDICTFFHTLSHHAMPTKLPESPLPRFKSIMTYEVQYFYCKYKFAALIETMVWFWQRLLVFLPSVIMWQVSIYVLNVLFLIYFETASHYEALFCLELIEIHLPLWLMSTGIECVYNHTCLECFIYFLMIFGAS